jgi:serine/threonine-protein kinase
MRTCPECKREFSAAERVCPDDGSLLKDKLSSEEQAIGRVLDGKYRIDGFLKRGGMGSVYRGTHLLLKKPVAIKLIRPELVTSNDMVERFFREARAAANLAHPNIVTVHDLGQEKDGTLYIIMEIVDGQSLKELIQAEGPWEPARALRFLRAVSSALSLAHRNGIVHRDLKPQNIMVFTDSEGSESPKLLDFGIAKTLDPDNPALTSTGMVLGTPHYMSAEQAKGLPADQRSDIYALGVILYEMLVGKVPFDDKSIPSILIKHLTEPPPPPSTLRGNIPREVEALVLRCLEKDPEKRVQSADELGKTLSGLMDTSTKQALDPTMAMDLSPEAAPTVATQSTMAGGAAAAAAFVPKVPQPPPLRDTTNRMESGTVRAREMRAATPPPIVVKPSRSRAGLVVFAAIVVGFLAILATGAFLVVRLGGRSAPEAKTASAGVSVPDMPPPAEENPPPSDVEPPGTVAASGTAEAPETEKEPTKAPAATPRRAETAPPPPVAQRTPEQTPPTTPPTQPALAQPKEEPIPEKPSVAIECAGVSDACAAIRMTLREALDKRGMPAARPVRADVILNVQAEEIGSRSETQFGNTFVVRDYSVTVEAEAPRFGDSMLAHERTFSFDPRLGRDKLRAEAHVIANAAAERIERYWESKRSR